MCGIFAYFNPQGRELSTENIRKMGHAIRHRGPDGEGSYSFNGVTIGNQRLAIIDLEGGAQPIYSEDGNISVVQNGEIYNYLELLDELKSLGIKVNTQSDTGAILCAYQAWGEKLFEKLNGMFSIAIFDKSKNQLLVARDRMGIKPLYVYKKEESLYFASEIKAILSQLDSTPAVNQEALQYYLQLGYVPPPYTLFEGISHVDPGTYWKMKGDSVDIVKWWNLSENSQDQLELSEESSLKEIESLYADSVRLRMRADVGFGAFLSGGIDSSFNVANMVEFQDEPVQTFNVSFEGTKFDEQVYAKRMAEKFKTQHSTIPARREILKLWPTAVFYCDQPHADVSFFPTHRVSELAARSVKMVLTGDGADEILAGYEKYLAALDVDNQGELIELYCRQNFVFDGNELQSLTDSSKALSFKAKLSEQLESVAHWDFVNQYLYLDCINLLVGNNLVKPDRMGMSLSLEARVPFLDHRLVELSFQISGAMKLKDRETKYLLKKLAADKLGHDHVYREKQMFSVPITEWSDFDLSDLANRLLLHESSMSRKYINLEKTKQLIDNYTGNPRGILKKLRILISFEIWLQIFYGGKSVEEMESYFS